MLEKIINFINKHLTHNRDKDGDFGIRVVIHVPVGIVIGILLVICPIAGLGLVLLFGLYEWTEDWRVQDHAWKDLFGALCGCIIGVVVGVILQLTTQYPTRQIAP